MCVYTHRHRHRQTQTQTDTDTDTDTDTHTHTHTHTYTYTQTQTRNYTYLIIYLHVGCSNSELFFTRTLCNLTGTINIHFLIQLHCTVCFKDKPTLFIASQISLIANEINPCFPSFPLMVNVFPELV